MHNPYYKGAEQGLVMGGCLSAAFILQALGNQHIGLGLLGALLLLAMPVLAYVFLRRAYLQDKLHTHYSSLWMQGIMMFLCGSIIMALVIYVYMRFIDPEFIINQMRSAVEVYDSLGTPEAQNVASTLQMMIDKHLLPTPMTLTVGSIWLVSFTGAVLSALLSGMVKFFVKR